MTTHAQASGDGGRFVKREIVLDGAVHRYQVFVPDAAVAGEHPPVILFLHGTGERGSDGDKQTQVGLGPYVRTHMNSFPAIAVFPQAPDDRDWIGETVDMALAMLEAATGEFHGDRDRTYLTGLSMGGYGTWETALTEPQRFAALVPVCGAIHPPRPERQTLAVTRLMDSDAPYRTLAERLRHLPIWIFHGARDDVVPTTDDHRIFAALIDAGADARYTEFPDDNHNAWDSTYRSAGMWEWLFKQNRSH
ncbi:phospholipase [Pseudoxanthomonas kalamensis DSM 18571]|uniref:carboxylesterase family protein n=1 Tax=Pseudoxanthomonas kalamensis TaxID=289483 RepID=UPI001390E834|nr:phospholipase [Pseudoxanthomonas kalamensis DSM 18571]